jgi:hypothetical protein
MTGTCSVCKNEFELSKQQTWRVKLHNAPVVCRDPKCRRALKDRLNARTFQAIKYG